MNIRSRTILLLGATLAVTWALLYFLSRASLLGSFASLDEREVRQNIERTRRALSLQADHLVATLGDWSNWDDAYAFVVNHDSAFVDSNLADQTFTNLGLNAIIFLDYNGEVVYSQGFDLQAKASTPVSPDLLRRVAPGGLLQPLMQQGATIHGIISLAESPMLIAFQPILTSKAEGPSHGTLVFGQYLNDQKLEQLAQTTNVNFSLQLAGAAREPADSQAVRAVAQLPAESVVVRPLNNDLMAGYTLLDDYTGQPAWLLRVDKPREIYRQGQASLLYFQLQLVLVGLLLSGVILWLLERSVLSRLARLSAGVTRVGADSNFSTRVTVEGKDEIGRLALTINQTLERLELSHSLLQTTLESTDAGILTVDTAGRLVTTNRQFYALWDLPDSLALTQGDACLTALAEKAAQPARALERLDYWCAHPTDQGGDEFELTCGRTLECYTLPERLGGAEGKIIGRIFNFRDITARKQAQATLNRQVGELITVRDIALIGSEANSSGVLVELATKIIAANLYPTEIFNIGLVDEATGRLQVFTPYYVRGDIPGYTLQPGRGIPGRAVATGQTQIVGDVRLDPDYLEIDASTRSEICVPLKIGNRVLGLFNVESARPGAFGLADERLLIILAGQMATALEKVRMSAEVQRLAITDSLTDLYNRHYFFSAGQRELDHARRYGRALSAVMLDLDYFKRINDTYGHARGDLVLKSVAAFCKKSLRESDLLGRYGGEEFIILLTETPLKQAQLVAERLRAGIARLNFPALPGQSLTITASMGVAELDDTMPTLDKLLDCADQALYQAKNGGRNDVRSWAALGEKAAPDEAPEQNPAG